MGFSRQEYWSRLPFPPPGDRPNPGIEPSSPKSRDITLPTKVRLVKAMVFPVVMYGCESWTVKKAEHRRIDAFELWCWRRLLRVPWTARRSNQSILNEIGPGCSLEGLMLKLKLQYSGYFKGKCWLIGKDSDAGRDWGQEKKGTREDEMAGWHHRLDGRESEWTLGVGDGQGGLACCDSWGRKEWDMTEWLNWTEFSFPYKTVLPMFLINDTDLTVLFVSMMQILFGRWPLLGKRCPYILSGNLGDFCFVCLAVLTRKSLWGHCRRKHVSYLEWFHWLKSESK